ADTRELTAAPDGTWSTAFSANDDYTWSASSQGWSTPAAKTLVTPEVTAPALPTGRVLFIGKGQSVSLTGTALPDTTVQAVTTPDGGTATKGPALDVGADGTWDGITVAPTTATNVSLQRNATAASASFTVYPVSALTTTAATSGYAQRALTWSGDAGHAPLSVQLWTRPAGAASYALAGTVTAATSGAYTVSTMLPATSSPTPMAWKVVTTDGTTTFGTTTGTVNVLPLFAPTSTAPSGGAYKHTVAVSGSAVPGDVVTLWTRPATGGAWSRAASSTSNASTGAFNTGFTLLRDTLWRVTSATGTSAARSVVVRPTLAAPTRAKRAAMVYLSGWA
ncbi:MAG TPA: hypothetical protein VKJ07_20195, partial [Mycobacteriales bacterium]|nr:hypothetical protein [Mycobacteriales bacterium]